MGVHTEGITYYTLIKKFCVTQPKEKMLHQIKFHNRTTTNFLVVSWYFNKNICVHHLSPLLFFPIFVLFRGLEVRKAIWRKLKWTFRTSQQLAGPHGSILAAVEKSKREKKLKLKPIYLFSFFSSRNQPLFRFIHQLHLFMMWDLTFSSSNTYVLLKNTLFWFSVKKGIQPLA